MALVALFIPLTNPAGSIAVEQLPSAVHSPVGPSPPSVPDHPAANISLTPAAAESETPQILRDRWAIHSLPWSTVRDPDTGDLAAHFGASRAAARAGDAEGMLQLHLVHSSCGFTELMPASAYLAEQRRDLLAGGRNPAHAAPYLERAAICAGILERVETSSSQTWLLAARDAGHPVAILLERLAASSRRQPADGLDAAIAAAAVTLDPVALARIGDWLGLRHPDQRQADLVYLRWSTCPAGGASTAARSVWSPTSSNTTIGRASSN